MVCEMNTWKYLALGALVLASLGTANASSREYVGLTGDVVTVCYGDGSSISVGAVCWDGGSITPDQNGQATVSLADDVVNPVSGTYCQDLNNDHLCGDATVGEPFAFFCGGVTLTDGTDWTSSATTTIFIDGPVFGSPAFSTCGLTDSMGTHGFGNSS